MFAVFATVQKAVYDFGHLKAACASFFIAIAEASATFLSNLPSLNIMKQRWLLYMLRSSSPFLPTSKRGSVPDSYAFRLFTVRLTAFAFAFSCFVVPLRPLPVADLPPFLPLAALPTFLPIVASSPFLPLGALPPFLPPDAGLPSLLSVAGLLPSFQSISP